VLSDFFPDGGALWIEICRNIISYNVNI